MLIQSLMIMLTIVFSCFRLFATWSTPDYLDTLSPQSSIGSAQVSSDDEGHAVAVWVHNNAVYAAHYNGSVWVLDSALSGIGTATSPQVSMGATGHAMAIWRFVPDASPSTVQIAASFFNGTSWGPAVYDLEPTTTTASSDPQIAMNDSDRALAVWVFGTGPTTNVNSKYFNGTTWVDFKSAVVTAATITPNTLRVAIDNNGNGVSIRKVESDGLIYANRYTAASGGSWGSDGFISSSLGPQRPQLSIDKTSGNAISIWATNTATIKIQANFYTFSTGLWTTVLDIGDATAGSSTTFDSSISMNTSGKALAVWVGYVGAPDPGGVLHVVSRQFVGGTWNLSSWSSVTNVVTGNTTSSSLTVPKVSFNNSNNAFAVWRQSAPGQDDVIQANYFDGSSWGSSGSVQTFAHVGPSTDSTDEPQISLSDNGKAFALWKEVNPGAMTGYVVQSVFSNPTPPPPPPPPPPPSSTGLLKYPKIIFH